MRQVPSLRMFSIAVLTMLFTACGDTTSPTAPTPTMPAEVSFDDMFWRELIYGELGRSRQGLGLEPESRIVSVQRNYSIEPEGMPDSLIQDIREAIPVLWEQVTGEPFAGEIIIGRRYPVPAWTTIRNRPHPTVCATAGIPTDNGSNEITLDLADPACGNFVGLFGHEFGHDLGLWHVTDSSALMHRYVGGKTHFSQKEMYHAQLAYRIGPGKPYCGDPRGASCQ